jgi:hypothetical protein
MRLKLLTATAVLTAAIASPAVAMGPHARSEAVQPDYRSGFWPGDVAAGIVGGAIGTAGAIATAPFGYNAYNGYYGPYAYNNGGCRPGATFIGADGLRHVCR